MTNRFTSLWAQTFGLSVRFWVNWTRCVLALVALIIAMEKVAVGQEVAKPVWSYDAELITRPGVQKYRLGTNAFWYPYDSTTGRYDTSEVDDFVLHQRIELHKNETTPLLMDIEAFRPHSDDPAEREFAFVQLRKAAKAWRRGAPHRRIGYYDVWHRDYWSPLSMHSELIQWRGGGRAWKLRRDQNEKWKRRNELIANEIRPLVDFTCFSLYDFYSDPRFEKNWRIYADANLREMERLYPNKQRLAIIWPRFHNGTLMPLKRWKATFEFVMAHQSVDGVVIFQLYPEGGVEGWRDVVAQPVVVEASSVLQEAKAPGFITGPPKIKVPDVNPLSSGLILQSKVGEVWTDMKELPDMAAANQAMEVAGQGGGGWLRVIQRTVEVTETVLLPSGD